MSLDRFSQGVKDPQEKEVVEVGVCKGCGDSILPYDEVYIFPTGDLVHNDTFCLEKYVKNRLGAYVDTAIGIGEATRSWWQA